MTEDIEQRPVGKQINNNYDIVIFCCCYTDAYYWN